MNFWVRNLYSESTLDAAIERLTQSEAANQDISSILRQLRVDKRTLERTAKKGLEEYVDGLIALRHAWKPKMMDGNPKEKSEIYDGLHDTVKRIDEFSEPYVSAMRLLAAVALRQLATTAESRAEQAIEEALLYEGAHYAFDEQNVSVTVNNGLTPTHKKEGNKPASAAEAYGSIATGFMQLKDVLNLIEDATAPQVYENVRNTNEFPEARIGKCFEVTHKIDRTLKQIERGYEFLLKKGELPQGDRRRIQETLELLRSSDRGWITRSTQWYAALQFNEKPWNTLYWASILATGAGVGGAAYSYSSDPKELGLFFASAAWTIASGAAIYLFTDAGPKTAKLLRKLDERILRYHRV